MYQVSNKKGSYLTRETLAEALAALAEKYGKRGILHACEVMETPIDGFFLYLGMGDVEQGRLKPLRRHPPA